MTRMQMAYLRSVLSQNVGAFDTDLTTANIMAGATNHMSVIKDAIGEKVSVCIPTHSLYASTIQIEAEKVCSMPRNHKHGLTSSDGSLHLQFLHILSRYNCCFRVLLGGGYDVILSCSDAPRDWSNICQNDEWHVNEKDSFGL